MWSWLKYVAVCCSVLQYAAVRLLTGIIIIFQVHACYNVVVVWLQCVAVCCSVLQCVAVWCSVVQCSCCSIALQCVEVCCSVVAVWLQCGCAVAMWL